MAMPKTARGRLSFAVPACGREIFPPRRSRPIYLMSLGTGFFRRGTGPAILVVLVALLAYCQPAAALVADGNRIMDQRMEENLCALTFDDGPSPNTARLLDMLDRYGIRASFFLLGRNAALYPHVVRRMADEGHEVGNHSYSHPNLRRMGPEAKREEIVRTDEILRGLGVTPLYMRPPYGAFDGDVTAIAEELGVSVILWSLDSHDWKGLPADYAGLRSTRGTVYEPGSLHGIFLFHDTHRSTVEDLPRIISQLVAGGCQRFVTVSEYLAGINDPEPPALMSRRSAMPAPPPARKSFAAGTSPVPLARSSRPWTGRAGDGEIHPLAAMAAHQAFSQ